MIFFPIAAGYVTSTDYTTAIMMMTLGIGLNGFAESGFLINHLDIAPAFASVLLGVTNTAGTMSGIISPTLTGFIVQHHVREHEVSLPPLLFFPCLLVTFFLHFFFLSFLLPSFLVYLLTCLFFPSHFNSVFLSHQSAKEWRMVFYINGAIYLVGGTFYVLFASGEKQPWANGNKYEKLTTNESSTDEHEQ